MVCVHLSRGGFALPQHALSPQAVTRGAHDPCAVSQSAHDALRYSTFSLEELRQGDADEPARLERGQDLWQRLHGL